MQKKCLNCLEEKDFSHFNKRAESPDGHTPWCKPCIAVRRNQPFKGRTSTPPEKRQEVYLAAILRMKDSGIISSYTARQMAERIGAGS